MAEAGFGLFDPIDPAIARTDSILRLIRSILRGEIADHGRTAMASEAKLGGQWKGVAVAPLTTPN